MLMSSATYDTLILSDLHLGSHISRAQEAMRMLKETSFRRLVLLGDIFSDLNFGRLTKDHWKFLGYIRKLSNPKRNIEVVWVEGNHDQGLTNVMSHLVGVKVYQEYVWEFQGRKHLAVHGHQFDRFAVNNVLLSNLGSFLHLQLQKRSQITQKHIVHREAVELMSMHRQMFASLKLPNIFLIHLHTHQVRHDIRQPLIMISFNPHHFNIAFGIRQLANVAEKLPVIFGEPSEIQVGKDVAEQN